MSLKERNRHMKQGLCFRCHKAGHISRECAQTRPTGSRPIQNTNTPPVTSSSSTIPNILLPLIPKPPTPMPESRQYIKNSLTTRKTNLPMTSKARVFKEVAYLDVSTRPLIPSPFHLNYY